MKVVVYGSEGRMGKFRSRILKERGVEVVGIDLNSESNQSIEDADGFVVATPLSTHTSLLYKLIVRGKPIFIEKPMAGSYEEISKLFNFAAEYGTPIYVAWQRRQHADYIEMKKTLNNVNNDWRKIHIVSADNPSPPEHVLNIPNYIHSDFMGHDINELLWMTDNELPISISVTNKKLFNNKAFDYSKIELNYSNDRVAYLEGYTKNPSNHYGQELTINTPDYTIKSKTVTDKRSFPEFYSDAFEEEIDLFVEVMKGNEEFPEQRIQNELTAQLIEAVIEVSNATTPIEFIGDGNFGSYIRSITAFMAAPTVNTSTKGKTLSEIYYDKSIKKVYVCTPDATHDDIAMMMLDSGKAVLCEKPVSDIEGLIKKAKEKNVPFQIGFQRRFDDRYREAIKYAQKNPPKTIEIISRDPVPFDPDSKFVVANSMIHDFDVLTGILPDASFDVKEVFAVGSTIDVKVVATREDKSKVEVLFVYAKENETYQQQVIFDDDWANAFGFNYIVEDGVKVFESYRSAYINQFVFFTLQTEFDEELANSYLKTIKLVKDTIACL